MNEVFQLGSLPTNVLAHVNRDINSLLGSWQEVNKPRDLLLDILKRLSVSGIKRRMVVGTDSIYELNSVTNAAAKIEGLEVFADISSPMSHYSETEASTEPSSPAKVITNDGGKWYQKQHFPSGRYVDCEFEADGKTSVVIKDNETGEWSCIACIKDGILYQKRTSDKLQVTLYETRAVVNQEFVVDGDCVKFLDGQTNNNLQFFQWVMEDHKDGKITKAHYFLKRV